MRRLFRSLVARAAQIFWAAQPMDLRERQSALRAQIAQLKAEIAGSMPGNPVLDGFKVYSQFDEDGIIETILKRIAGACTFIEIGCGNGLENNTHYLLLKGFSGVWIDGSKDNVEFIRRQLPSAFRPSSKLLVLEEMIDIDNTVGTIEQACLFIGTKEPDFFSIDIDGNDVFVLEKALSACSPKVICVEYNSKFPPPMKLTIAYDPGHAWINDDYAGASLQKFCDMLGGYRLACCNLTGANAFFVRDDLASPFPSYPVEQLYQPPRYDLIYFTAGHRPSLNWLNNLLSGKN